MKKIILFIWVLSFCRSAAQIPLNFNVPDVMIESSNAPNSQYLELGENSVYINPIHPNYVVNSNNAYIAAPGQTPSTMDGQAIFFSNTGGQTWHAAFPNSIGFINPSAAHDPSVLIDKYNRMYINYLDATTANIQLSYTDDNFNTFNGPYQVSSMGGDKNYSEIDNRPTADHIRIFTGWNGYQSGGKDIFIRRADVINQNIIWNSITDDLTDPITYIQPSYPNFNKYQGVNIAIAPNGDAFATWGLYYGSGANVHEKSIGFAKWDHTLNSWNSGYIPDLEIKGIRNNVSVGNIGTQQCASWMTMGINQQKGDIYIVWPNVGVPCTSGNIPNCNQCSTPGSCSSDIYFIKSSDDGISWSTPQRINVPNGQPHWDSWLACDPYTGYLGVIYYGNDNTGNTQTYLALSVDDGANWTEQKISDGSFNPPIIHNSATDYITLKIINGSVVPIWTGTDPNNGRPTAFCQQFEMDVPMNLSLCDPVTPFYKIEKATNQILVSDQNCGYVVLSGSDINMYAGNNIKLSEGFHAERGSTFRAHIESTVNAFSANTRNAGEEIYSKDLEKTSLQISAYPNPFTEYINIKVTSEFSSFVNIDLYDNMGRVVKNLIKNFNMVKGTTNYHLNTSDFSLKNGIYFFVIHTSKESKSIKLICVD